MAWEGNSAKARHTTRPSQDRFTEIAGWEALAAIYPESQRFQEIPISRRLLAIPRPGEGRI
jgi:hypothetical protein